MSTKKQIIIFSIALGLFIVPTFASAAGLVPCGGASENPCTIKDIFVLVAKVTNALVAFAGVYAVYQIVNGGFWLVVTMGNEEAIKKHSQTVTNAVVGLVFTLLAFVFVNTAVNFILFNGVPACKLNLKDPLNYVLISDAQYNKCVQDYNEGLKK